MVTTGSEWVLGLDLGSDSIGWAAVTLKDSDPAECRALGVRIFEAATEGNREAGEEEPRNKTRREKRLLRRQIRRRARRLQNVFRLLQEFGLLPPGDGSLPVQRQALLTQLDQKILASPWFQSKAASGCYPEPRQTLPYILRAAALDERLEPYSLGRALYHLAQRRGFLSNRIRPARADKQDEDEGKVKSGISELRQKMQQVGARTLGEYFAGLNPHESRIRNRYTARQMYLEEFEAIWESQARWHAERLTNERKKALHKAIFYQRPLWFDPDRVGQCELEPGQPRARAHLLAAQRFRMLQAVNNLQVLARGQRARRLSLEEHRTLCKALETQGDLEFSKIRKLLGLGRDVKFNLEAGGEKRIPGNRTAAAFYQALGERWLALSEDERERLVEYVYAFQKPEKLPQAAQKKWNLDPEAAQRLAEITFEKERLSLSLAALRTLLPLLEQCMTFAEARRKAYPERFASGQVCELLPPVADALKEIRNPAVMRSLTELRKIVNALIRRYGKPAEIHIELARDLRNPKWRRQELWDRMRKNEVERKRARQKILDELKQPNFEPSPEDILKVRLAEECSWRCPYTGKSISMRALVGPEPEFQIEHIIPFSRSLDNRYVNLTLCHVSENQRKYDRTPWEAYAGDRDLYEKILDRVKQFQGRREIAQEKLRRFQMNDEELKEELNQFSERQLRDTAYASRLAQRYLGLLFGCNEQGVDANGRRRVQATSGMITAHLRDVWHLNSILNDGPTTNGGRQPKPRADHRHHAIDALVVALTTPAMVQRLNDAAARAQRERRRRFASVTGPWPNFVDSVRTLIDSVVVSHRVSRKVSGQLHEDTHYARVRRGNTEETRVRKPLNALTEEEAKNIADPVIRQLVLEKLGDGDPKKVFASEANLPRLPSRRHPEGIPIRRVRVIKPETPVELVNQKTGAVRRVLPGSNHHVEIIAKLDQNGDEVAWEGRVVSMLEAYRRKQSGQPIIQRDHGPGYRFKFSLCQGDTIECQPHSNKPALFVVRGVSQYSAGQIVVGLAPVTDARKKSEMLKSRAWLWRTPNTLMECKARKLTVSPIGEVSEAHD
ncbi:MAG: type II CRISPR RNA-guided endonuclease Cas9 [Firmicutes bacterium]|nr:type II CRISPR RNA-guided endonuclease Cas9 [Bacillota bacterium]